MGLRRGSRDGGQLPGIRVGHHTTVAERDRAAVGQDHQKATADDRDTRGHAQDLEAGPEHVGGWTGGTRHRCIGPSAPHQQGGGDDRVRRVESGGDRRTAGLIPGVDNRLDDDRETIATQSGGRLIGPRVAQVGEDDPCRVDAGLLVPLRHEGGPRAAHENRIPLSSCPARG